MPRMTFSNPLALLKIGRIETNLRIKPMTSRQLADSLHADRTGICVYLRHMRDNRQIHIAGYIVSDTGGRAKPLYAWGAGRDKPEPIKLTTRSQRRKAKLRSMKQNDPAAYVDYLMAQRGMAAKRRLKSVVRNKPLATWLDALAA